MTLNPVDFPELASAARKLHDEQPQAVTNEQRAEYNQRLHDHLTAVVNASGSVDAIDIWCDEFGINYLPSVEG